MNGTPRTIWSRRSSVRCLWWVSLRCCNGRRLALASILFPSLPLGEMPARAAVRAQEWVGERRTQSETHSLIRTHAISRSIFYPLRLSVMLRSGLHDPSARSQRLVARKSPRRYIAKGSNGGTARGSTENLTYTGLTAGVASAI